MKKPLLIYKSNTGFTKKYVDWILEEVHCTARQLDQITEEDIKAHDLVVYGGGIRAGQISGLKKALSRIDPSVKQVIVFATGAAPYTDEIVNQITINNFSDINATVDFYYFESGLDYEKMSFLNRMMMNAYSKMLANKENKSDVEKGVNQALLSSYDHCKKENITPLVLKLKALIFECSINNS